MEMLLTSDGQVYDPGKPIYVVGRCKDILDDMIVKCDIHCRSVIRPGYIECYSDERRLPQYRFFAHINRVFLSEVKAIQALVYLHTEALERAQINVDKWTDVLNDKLSRG